MEKVIQLAIPKEILDDLIAGKINFFSLNVNFPRRRKSVLSIVRKRKVGNEGETQEPSDERLFLTKKGLEKRFGFECVDSLRREKVKFLQITSKLVNEEVKLVKLVIYY